MPLKLGVTTEPSFCVVGGLDADAAFIDGVIWLHERVFMTPDWSIRAEWLLTHEVLHAKIHVARMASRSWLGKRRLGILELAARDALWLTHSHPPLAPLSAVLVQYRDAGLDDAEEALVRYLQLLDEDDEFPVTPMLLRARRILHQRWGWSPLKMFRTMLWLPVCAWTVRFR
jgi:hypothetical protein